MVGKTAPTPDFWGMVVEIKNQLRYTTNNVGELAAFVAYAQAFPDGMLALVDQLGRVGGVLGGGGEEETVARRHGGGGSAGAGGGRTTRAGVVSF